VPEQNKENSVPNPVMHFEILADDPSLVRGFYLDLFGWQATDYPGMDYALLSSGHDKGASGGLSAASPALPRGLAVYVQVEDIAAVLARAHTLRPGAVLQEPYEVPGVGRFALLADPEGNRVGLWQLPAGEV
jgi:predicted enzyme related to lactoylglutathione lyase